jgi:hypothetical protein
MVVPIADAAALDCGEAETGTNGSVGRETPFTHVTIPAGFHLAYKNHLRAGDVDAYTEEVARVRARIHNGLGFAVAKHETRSDDLACCLDLTLLVLPIPVGPTSISVVLNVQNRDVRAVENALSTVVDIAKLNTGPVSAGGGCRPNREEAPQRLPPALDPDPDLARCSLIRCGLPRIDWYTAESSVSWSRARRCVLWEADDTVFEQVHRDNFVRGMLFGRQEANGD